MSQRILPILFATLVIDAISFGIVIPIIPVVLTNPDAPQFILHGFTKDQQLFFAGFITAIFGVMQFFAAPIIGELSDVYGRKKLLILGVAVLAISQILFGMAIVFGLVWLLIVSRIVGGLASANVAVAQATIADVTEPKDRAKNFGLIGAAFGIGFIVGTTLSGWIAAFTGHASAPFWVAGVLGLINVISVTFFLSETRKRTEREAHRFTIFKGVHNVLQAIRDVDARPLYTVSFLYVAGFAFFVSFAGIYLVDKFSLSEAGVGTFFGVIGVWIAITQGVILRIVSKHYSEKTILRTSMLLMFTGLVLFPLMPSMAWVYAIMPIIAIGNGLSLANIGGLISKSVSPDKQGAALGVNGSLGALGNSAAPLIAGLASGVLGVAVPFMFGSVLVLAAWMRLFLFGQKKL